MHTELTDPTPAGNAEDGRWRWRLALACPLLALLITRPWQPGAFPVWDFAEMLPILREADGPLGALRDLAAFTRADGRANYLTYLQVVGTWLVAGESAIGWQWQRAVMMLLLGMLFVVTVRKLGGRPFAAGAGALLLLLAVPGTEGWLLLSGEPLAAALLLLVVLLGSGAASPPRIALLLLAALGTMLAKEVVGVALPAALILALGWDPVRGIGRRWNPRTMAWVVAGLAAVLAIEGASVLAAIGDARSDAYATQFRPGMESLARVPRLFQAMVLPVSHAANASAGLLYPANVAFLLVLLAGGSAWWHSSDVRRRRGDGVLVVLLLSLPAVGALTYAFWPRYSAFYGIPFALGGAGLLAAALTRAAGRGKQAWVLAALSSTAVVLFTAIASARTVAERRAFANLAFVAVHQLDQLPGVDSVLLVKAGPGRNRWPITGAELARYGVAMRLDATRLPVIRDASCAEVAARLREPLGSTAILNDQNACGPLPAASHRFQAAADHLDWLTFGVRPDTLRLELLATETTPR